MFNSMPGPRHTQFMIAYTHKIIPTYRLGFQKQCIFWILIRYTDANIRIGGVR